jgi:hypothetical protein
LKSFIARYNEAGWTQLASPELDFIPEERTLSGGVSLMRNSKDKPWKSFFQITTKEIFIILRDGIRAEMTRRVSTNDISESSSKYYTTSVSLEEVYEYYGKIHFYILLVLLCRYLIIFYLIIIFYLRTIWSLWESET